jgi:hypothetical protein
MTTPAENTTVNRGMNNQPIRRLQRIPLKTLPLKTLPLPTLPKPTLPKPTLPNPMIPLPTLANPMILNPTTMNFSPLSTLFSRLPTIPQPTQILPMGNNIPMQTPSVPIRQPNQMRPLRDDQKLIYQKESFENCQNPFYYNTLDNTWSHQKKYNL